MFKQAELMMEVKPGALFRHYKGGIYRVFCLSRLEASNECQVTYEQPDNEIWQDRYTRPWHEFIVKFTKVVEAKV